MKKAISRKRDFSKITVNGQPLEVLSVLDIEVPVWRDPEKGEVWVFLKPVVEQLDLSWPRQNRKIQTDSPVFSDTVAFKATVSPNPTNPEESIIREALFIKRKGFLFWLARLSSSRVKPEKRDLIERFHMEVADALERYFSEGVAVNTRLLQEAPQAAPQIAQNFSRQMGEALSEKERLDMLKEIVSLMASIGATKYAEIGGRFLIARLTGDASLLPAPQDLPVDLTTWARDRLSREGISLPYQKLRSFAQGMGQRAAHLYKAHYGEPPEKRTQEIGGVVRAINAYYLPQHEGVLEEAFQKTLQDWHDKKRL